MTTPVKIFGKYVVCIETPDEEDVSARKHFISEWGWSAREFAKIKNFPWFRVEVSIWKDGEELAIEHLGCCSYKTREEFHTVYAGDYFADMVHECANTIKDPALMASVDAWRDSFRNTETLGTAS